MSSPLTIRFIEFHTVILIFFNLVLKLIIVRKAPQFKYKTKQFKVDHSKTTKRPGRSLLYEHITVIYANTKIILRRLDLRLRYSYQCLPELLSFTSNHTLTVAAAA